jgi:hypothetical protein
MILQTTWFFLQVVARAVQHLAVSTLELTVLGFVFCTYISTFLWWKKLLDVGTPIILKSEFRIADILVKAGDQAKDPYKLTPLDFVDAPPGISTVRPFWFALGYLLGLGIPPKTRPINFFPNSGTTPPRGLGNPIMIFETIGAINLVGIQLVGWNFYTSYKPRAPLLAGREFDACWHHGVLPAIPTCWRPYSRTFRKASF